MPRLCRSDKNFGFLGGTKRSFLLDLPLLVISSSDAPEKRDSSPLLGFLPRDRGVCDAD